MNKEINLIQETVNNLLNGKTQLKRKKVKKVIQEKQLFVDIINNWKESIERENFLTQEVGVNFSGHNNLYYHIISELVELKFGSEISELVHFFVYEHQNKDGSKNQLKDNEGRLIKLESVEDLWDLIIKIIPEIEKNKK